MNEKEIKLQIDRESAPLREGSGLKERSQFCNFANKLSEKRTLKKP